MPRWEKPRRLNKTPAELLAYAREQGFAVRLDPAGTGLRIGGNPPTMVLNALRVAKVEIIDMLKNEQPAPPATASTDGEKKPDDAVERVAAVEPPLVDPFENRRIALWIANRIVDWPPGQCFGCKRSILPGEQWLDVAGNDGARARFHATCRGAWLVEQETLARRALGLDRSGRE